MAYVFCHATLSLDPTSDTTTTSEYGSPRFVPCKNFFQKRPKSFFGELFSGTRLGSLLKRMSDSKAIPKGLKDHECEKGTPNRPPIPYVPETDEVQETVQECRKQYFKIKLEDKTEFSVAIWDAGTNEAFLNHVLSALNACD